jgi:polyisoprenoid-binding protein YceI
MRIQIRHAMILTLILLLATACSVLQEPAEPSGTLEAVPLESESEEDVAATAVPAAEEEPTAEAPTAEAAAEDSDSEAETADTDTGERQVYTISQADSQVRFELDEDLRGSRVTVVGVTDQAAGEIALNLSDLSTAEVGVIQINARTLETDNSFRNRAIQNRILETGTYEFITFTPTAVNGLPESAEVGEEISFTMEGDLTIRDVTQPVTFDVAATAVSPDQISGTASAVISREAYGLQIPEVPDVANVEDEVDLYIDFVANSS